MHVIRVRNVHQALPEGLRMLNIFGREADSRNGTVVVAPTPVTTVYGKPMERVLFWPLRDANPFFHLMEAIWMMSGSDRVDFPAAFAKQIAEYSDDGKTLNGAYGKRWRYAWSDSAGHVDQIKLACQLLKANPNDRRVVIQMWNVDDLGFKSKDLPCNTNIYLSVGEAGDLQMTVCNRSNDIVWGAYGANAVHFSFLQELIARECGLLIGPYYQMSNNFHAYKELYDKVLPLADETPDGFRTLDADPYTLGRVSPYPVSNGTELAKWFQQADMFVNRHAAPGVEWDPFFVNVAEPMRRAFLAYKRGEPSEGIRILDNDCHANDWSKAGKEWLQRRADRKAERGTEHQASSTGGAV